MDNQSRQHKVNKKTLVEANFIKKISMSEPHSFYKNTFMNQNIPPEQKKQIF